MAAECCSCPVLGSVRPLHLDPPLRRHDRGAVEAHIRCEHGGEARPR
jgi:hypothetical protein